MNSYFRIVDSLQASRSTTIVYLVSADSNMGIEGFCCTCTLRGLQSIGCCEALATRLRPPPLLHPGTLMSLYPKHLCTGEQNRCLLGSNRWRRVAGVLLATALGRSSELLLHLVVPEVSRILNLWFSGLSVTSPTKRR